MVVKCNSFVLNTNHVSCDTVEFPEQYTIPVHYDKHPYKHKHCEFNVVIIITVNNTNT